MDIIRAMDRQASVTRGRVFETHVLLWLAGYGHSLVEHALDLLAQHPHDLTLYPAHLSVELAPKRVFQVNDLEALIFS